MHFTTQTATMSPLMPPASQRADLWQGEIRTLLARSTKQIPADPPSFRHGKRNSAIEKRNLQLPVAVGSQVPFHIAVF
jgi:hypothetical protein